MPSDLNNKNPLRYGFLLVPDYSMLAFTSAIEPLRMANRLAGNTLYQWIVVTAGGEPIPASNGMRVAPDAAVGEVKSLDALFVCGGLHIDRACNKTLIFWLRKLARQQMALGALCTGTYLLARAELLNGYRCTIHWENIASLREEFPKVIVSSELFEIDRDRYTSSGGVAPLDMMLHLIGERHYPELAAAISETFICERIRGRNDRQRIPLRMHLGTSQPKLVEAVSLMEANLEEPMTLDELARHVGLSRRQLERLFQKHLNCVPTRYYLELRLKRARQLLLQTSMSIVDVAFACGFVSAPHFSKCYRDYFSVPPRDERRLRRAPSAGGSAAAPQAGVLPESEALDDEVPPEDDASTA
jgi:transcriptional regulator GlxA family with amidase domain